MDCQQRELFRKGVISLQLVCDGEIRKDPGEEWKVLIYKHLTAYNLRMSEIEEFSTWDISNLSTFTSPTYQLSQHILSPLVGNSD